MTKETVQRKDHPKYQNNTYLIKPFQCGVWCLTKFPFQMVNFQFTWSETAYMHVYKKLELAYIMHIALYPTIRRNNQILQLKMSHSNQHLLIIHLYQQFFQRINLRRHDTQSLLLRIILHFFQKKKKLAWLLAVFSPTHLLTTMKHLMM